MAIKPMSYPKDFSDPNFWTLDKPVKGPAEKNPTPARNKPPARNGDNPRPARNTP